jgi:adenylate cyclase
VEQKISAGVWRIWHVAADVALATGAAEIGPVHFLYGILNFIEQSRANADELPEQDDSHERNRVSSVISEAGVDAVKIRHTLRIHLLQSEHRKQGLSNAAVRMTRSADSRVLFEAGEKAAAGGEMTALHLLAALCRCKDEQVLQALGEDRQKILALLYPAESGERSARTVAEPISDASEGGPKLTVLHQCDASMMIKSPETPTDNSQEFIALCELNWKAGTTGSLDQMFQNLLDGLMKIVTADRGAILVLDRSTGRWMLRTHSGSSTPRISMTSVREAVERKIGFIWKKGVDISMSQAEGCMEEGIYVPLLADDEVFGVVCLDSCSSSVRFTSADLRIVTALAHQTGLFIAHQEMRKQLTSNMKAMERLLTSFSPRVRTLLVQRVRQGKLHLGGERAVVTIVFVDIRGFTKLAASMDPEDLAELLNAYFSALSECVLRNEGTINDFVGDALVAVFGSPEPDPKHCHNALVTAVEMQTATSKITSDRIARGQVGCEIGIGVHFGEVLHGFIGCNDCMQYTVVGDIVNLASRYSTGAKGGTILVSPEVHAVAWAELSAVKITIPTKHEGTITAYQIEKLRTS